MSLEALTLHHSQISRFGVLVLIAVSFMIFTLSIKGDDLKFSLLKFIILCTLKPDDDMTHFENDSNLLLIQ